MPHDALTKNNLSLSGFLSGISHDKIEEITGRGIVFKLKAGERLFSQEDPALRCHLIIKGRLKLSRLHEHGREFIVRYISSGQITAAVAIFEGKTYSVSAHATEETETISWDRRTIIELMRLYPDLAVNLLKETVTRLEDMQSRYVEFAAEPVNQRIARALLRMVNCNNNSKEEQTLIMNRQELADYTGTTVYTVSRALSDWIRQGIIKPGREKIIILNMNHLTVISEGNNSDFRN